MIEFLKDFCLFQDEKEKKLYTTQKKENKKIK